MGTTNKIVGAGTKPDGGLDKVYVMKKAVDLTTATGTNATAADIWNLFTVPAYTLVKAAIIRVDTDAGATCTVDLGDGDGATVYFSNMDVNVTAGTTKLGNASSGAAIWTGIVNKYYGSSGGTVSITFDHTNSTLKATVFLECVDLS